MRTTHTIDKIIKEEVPVDCACDRCGAVITPEDIEWDEIHSFEGSGGLASLVSPLMKWKLDLCDQCFSEVLGPYVHVVPQDDDEDVTNGGSVPMPGDEEVQPLSDDDLDISDEALSA